MKKEGYIVQRVGNDLMSTLMDIGIPHNTKTAAEKEAKGYDEGYRILKITLESNDSFIFPEKGTKIEDKWVN